MVFDPVMIFVLGAAALCLFCLAYLIRRDGWRQTFALPFWMTSASRVAPTFLAPELPTDPLVLFLNKLSERTRRQIREPLPEEYLVAPMACIAAAYLDLYLNQEKGDPETYLEASVEALVGYNRTLKPLLPTTTGLFSVPITEINSKGLTAVFESLTKPYYPLSDIFRDGSTGYGRYESIRFKYRDDPKAQREHDKIDEQFAEDVGYEVYHMIGMLHCTPFKPEYHGILKLFDIQVPFPLSDETRFEHHWIVGGSGHGKTQTLQRFILEDLKKVEQGEASIIVLDSQDALIKNITSLDMFQPGQLLHDRLVWIDPTDVEYPVQLNLFDLNSSRPNTMLERERLVNSTLELYMFVLGSLLGSELTSKQEVIFKYVMRLMLHIPGASIQTLRELFEEGGYQKYKHYIDQLQGTARSFFQNEFEGRQFETTRKEVLRRLYGILSDRVFERMFSHPKNKLDLLKEINSGKIILINTAKDLLKETGTNIFGRFFIALITQAAQERAPQNSNEKLPTFVYIDDCGDYVKDDPNIRIILEQARKQNIGLILAHQYLSQVGSTYETLTANTSIKMAGGVSDADAHALARNMKTTPEKILRHPKFGFEAYVRNQTPEAIPITIPAGYLESYPRGEREKLRHSQRAKYASHYQDVDNFINQQPEPTGAKAKGSHPADDIDLSPQKDA